MHLNILRILLLFSLVAWNDMSIAGGSSIGKIENPYVQQLEHELEYEGLFLDTPSTQTTRQLHRFEYGQALSDKWLVEFGITAEQQRGSDLEIESFELEAKYQITEQGEFNNDWSLLVELEKENGENAFGLGATLIVLHEWQNWIGTANLGLEYEFGNDKANEVEASFSGQFKYRYKPSLEPALEVFAGEDGVSLGASLLGQIRLKNAKKYYWEAGITAGLSDDQPDFGVRVNIEYEFY